jgi:ABC-type protease/lipase transport system fused ATPase/permease subunit
LYSGGYRGNADGLRNADRRSGVITITEPGTKDFARAYYRDPALLLLDVATRGLGSDLERRVISNLRQNSVTKIIVFHSDLMMQAADEVLWLSEGVLVLSRYG